MTIFNEKAWINRILPLSKYLIGGKKENGDGAWVQIRGDNNLSVHIDEPTTPFGEVAAIAPLPIAFRNFAYGIEPREVVTVSGSGGNLSVSDSQLVLSLDGTVNGYAHLRSKKYVPYRAGVGTLAKFTALFNSASADSEQLVGVGHQEDGYFFGYSGSNFGILHRSHGKLHMERLTVSVGSSTEEDISVVLDGTPYSSSVTNNGSTTATAREIAVSGTWSDIWESYAVSSSVYFFPRTYRPALMTGSFSALGTTVTASFSTFRSGSSANEVWHLQEDWNLDKMNGNGSSGMILDQTKGNVYQIKMRYLGYGNATFYIESSGSGRFTPVHQMKYSNRNIIPLFGDPAVSFNACIDSMGSTTAGDLRIASYGLFSYGEKELDGRPEGYSNVRLGVGTSYTNILSIRNGPIKGEHVNRSTVKMYAASVAVSASAPVQIYLLKNPNFTGNPVFNQASNQELESVQVSTSNVGVNVQGQITSLVLNSSGNDILDLADMNITLERGDIVCLAARATSGTAAFAASLTWKVLD